MRSFHSQAQMCCLLLALAATVACGRGGTGGSTDVVSEEAAITSALHAGLEDESMAEGE